MDAAIAVRRRQRVSSRREKRWSMNSQRLEEIVAELMKPISDARRSFDTDLSALLEEYLTEAGLHALEQEDAGAELVPNFAELALLLQQSANIYGRKVDCLHACVLSVCEALHAASELGNTSVAEAEAEAAQGGGRRSAGGARAEFAHIALRACAGAAREAGGARPPPTLPRQFAELQPRPATGAPLTDLAGDHIGFPADYYVLCRLQDGMLLEDLEEVEQVRSAGSEPAPALLELQAALAARGPSGPGPPAFSSPPLSKPPPSSPPPTPPPVPCATSTPLPPPAPPSLLLDSLFKKRRKRQSDERIENIAGTSIKMMMMRAAARLAQGAPRDLAGHVEQGAPRWEEGAPRWEHVARARAAAILRLRRRKPAPETGFKGFDFASPEDIGGFPGWSAAAAEQAEEALGRSAGSESEDDGFFEQSSVSESESLGGGARHEAVRAVAARVLAALAGRSRPTPLPAVLAAAHHHRDVSSLFLATLFLANAGNVEIIPGAALSLGACSLRLLSTDHALYCAAARDHLHLDI